ncbi:hypothetical protein P43SY_010927 [Pythium insidiosum]|uniref:Ubiquitin-like protease family profile domain-containing protein n=1 Tax=Pythium insidiosum TaxID=114742 RepID=A0AAD5LQH2_PYTIN|nr:hypothetical protein P43SY_010927 [Pythium insidiosum]
MPPVDEALRRLQVIPTKFAEAGGKKPKYSTQKNAVVIVDAFYLLPVKLLQACIAKLPSSNRAEDAISVYSQSQSSQSQGQSNVTHPPTGLVEVITISGIGTYTRETIEVMQVITELRTMCSRGVSFCQWMRTDVVCAVPADLQPNVKIMADMIEKKFPYDTLPGFAEDYHYSMFYNLKPPLWINDALILALCDRICSQHPTAVRYYDSLNNRSYKSALDKMSKDIIERVAPTYSVISLNSPIQFDSYSCGLFVCFKMWRHVDSKISTDMSDYGLGARRFELLRYVFEGVGSQVKQGTETES